MTKAPKDTKVWIALSGGVDSSVAAALLVEQGYDCTGVFMKNWSGEDFALESDCPWKQDQEDAEAVCKVLGIPFKSVNFEKEYRENVMSNFFEELQNGRTPNPDILCNEIIKFGVFLDRAIREGADMIATGHYAKVVYSVQRAAFGLFKGKDTNKDQTYFLHRLNQEQLSKTLFPIGGYQKAEIRKLAKRFNLPTAEKKDSQGICFVGKIRINDFIKEKLGEKQGNILDEEGKVIGTHNGTWFYTLGQRHGLGLGGGIPYYVSNIDIKSNTVTVAKGIENPNIYKDSITLENIHWISGKEPQLPLDCEVATRYTHKLARAKLEIRNSKFEICFEEAHRAPTPGQSAVLYLIDECLGGGIITH